MKDQVDILLATYQGELFIAEQLESIMKQSYPYFHIWIRDDCSTDQTLSIVQSFQQNYPDRISIVPSTQRLGIKNNFSELMRHAQAPYIMFSDQDDFWLPNKIEDSLKKIKEMENTEIADQPLLVHTDLRVVKSDLTLIHPSFWQYVHLNPHLTTLNRLLTQNNVTGCTVIMNQALLKKAYPIPPQAVMHDWWLALVAATFGKIDSIQEATMLYRQHGKNELGAQKFSLKKFIIKALSYKKSKKFIDKCDQAHYFLERYSSELSPEQKELVHAFSTLKELSYFRKIKRCLEYGFIPHLRF